MRKYSNVLCAVGNFRHSKPVFAACVMDYPEYSDLHNREQHVCFWCQCPKNELGDYVLPDKQLGLATGPNSRVGSGPWQWVLPHEKPGPLEVCRFCHQKPGISTSQRCFQLSIWVLIISWNDQYRECAVLPALSPPDFRYVIRPIFVESLSNTRWFHVKWALSSQPLNEYQSDRKSESGRWKSGQNCTIYVMIMSRYDENSNTELEAKVSKPQSWNCHPVPTQPKTRGFMCGPGNKPAKTKRDGFLAG